MKEFSHRTRDAALKRFRNETFDLLIIGGGITGAGTVRDAVSRGLKVALVEARDFAWGTSSRSSKLIHGGLRYLENMEFGLVFEALSERTHLLKTVPHMVRPLPFYMPIYKGERPGKWLLRCGMWLYDLLSLGRAPGLHKSYSKEKFLKEVPFLRSEGLVGGFRYFDASMWDDALAVETLRSASDAGAVIANYVEAVEPLWMGEASGVPPSPLGGIEQAKPDSIPQHRREGRIVGFKVRDLENDGSPLIELKAKKVIVCAGPWTDLVGARLSNRWRRWLNPSKGVHLLFDLKRIPVPGAVVMSHPDDHRISFVVPRPDYGQGVVIVGTTDGPTPPEPEKAIVESDDVEYLMDLLNKYFPTLNLTTDDIISAYVGVRPLMGAQSSTAGSEGQTTPGTRAEDLQKVSREHYIGAGPGGVIVVAGGKYTTHRLMAREIVDVALKEWGREAEKGLIDPLPPTLGPSRTDAPVNPRATADAVTESRRVAERMGWKIPEPLWSRYGAEALEIMEIREAQKDDVGDVEGFPFLGAQLRHEMRTGMVLHLEDFYLRRIPLFAARPDHGLPVAEKLAGIWAEERGMNPAIPAAEAEIRRLQTECSRRDEWRKLLKR